MAHNHMKYFKKPLSSPCPYAKINSYTLSHAGKCNGPRKI